MTTKKVKNVVRRPGRIHGDPDVEIPVPEDLATLPGIPKRENDVAFYSRTYPLESQNIEKVADREWVWTVYTEDVLKYRKEHDERNEPLVNAALVSGDIEPTGEAEPGKLPQFNREFFEIPHGSKEEWLFEEFKEKLTNGGPPSSEEVAAFAGELKEILDAGGTTRGDE